ncbi:MULTISPECIES: thermonuclease family protein [Bartonella]|uniref:Endonuclease YncB(Thermonuclease family) n=1 Tax=Bartonella chomelii TaxID=236402 RepID=A0ABR6E173_9HYPH|nr:MULTISPECIES: thermonuclease family protein [Bartonella]MBA9082312.1 endonuclease YncB(thermonuclease family) [Bartonella chomelii]
MRNNAFYFDLSDLYQKVTVLGTFIVVSVFINVTINVRCVWSRPQEVVSASTESITGNAIVIDGDSIRIGDVMIRLVGIDAPELRQFCGMEAERYPCGIRAKEHLQKLIANRFVTCYWDKKDKYQRVLGTCRTEKVKNINAKMVRDGWAISYYGYTYQKEEQKAKAQKKGIWQSHFQQPQEWRKVHPYIKR